MTLRDYQDAIVAEWLCWWFGTDTEAYEKWECFYWLKFEATPLSISYWMDSASAARLLQQHSS